mgnify:FL=1
MLSFVPPKVNETVDSVRFDGLRNEMIEQSAFVPRALNHNST